jgi:hypothetical protein
MSLIELIYLCILSRDDNGCKPSRVQQIHGTTTDPARRTLVRLCVRGENAAALNTPTMGLPVDTGMTDDFYGSRSHRTIRSHRLIT